MLDGHEADAIFCSCTRSPDNPVVPPCRARPSGCANRGGHRPCVPPQRMAPPSRLPRDGRRPRGWLCTLAAVAVVPVSANYLLELDVLWCSSPRSRRTRASAHPTSNPTKTPTSSPCPPANIALPKDRQRAHARRHGGLAPARRSSTCHREVTAVLTVPWVTIWYLSLTARHWWLRRRSRRRDGSPGSMEWRPSGSDALFWL